jgi:hypothetical protein
MPESGVCKGGVLSLYRLQRIRLLHWWLWTPFAATILPYDPRRKVARNQRGASGTKVFGGVTPIFRCNGLVAALRIRIHLQRRSNAGAFSVALLASNGRLPQRYHSWVIHREIIDTLSRRQSEGLELAALDLHILGLVAAGDGDLETSVQALIAAQAWEATHGYARAALHTAHTLALTTNFAGNLTKLDRYYQETLRTLKRLRNREGLALCLRSIGEMSLLKGHHREMLKSWELSVKLFSSLRLGEARQLGAWVLVARELSS